MVVLERQCTLSLVWYGSMQLVSCAGGVERKLVAVPQSAHIGSCQSDGGTQSESVFSAKVTGVLCLVGGFSDK